MKIRYQAVGQPDPSDVLTRPARAADLVIRYGSEPDQVADVHLPTSAIAASRQVDTPPLVLFIHGGFWRSRYGREHTAPLAEALSAAGFAVCAPEYRRTGQPGGGWPGTFDDITLAVDRLPGLVAEATDGVLDGAPLVLAGHSAGGHLALWAACRPGFPAESPWRANGPLATSVVALAAVSCLSVCSEEKLGDGAADELMGGGPGEFPERYAVADPSRLPPPGVPVRLVHGIADDSVPCQQSVDYSAAAPATGVTCLLLSGAGHFAVIDPLSASWPEVEREFRAAAGTAGTRVTTRG